MSNSKYLDKGGLNQIYVLDVPEKGTVVHKKAIGASDSKNAIQLIEEAHIFKELGPIEGLIECYGLVKTNKETVLELEYAKYGSLLQLQMYTLPFSEYSAFIVIR